MGDLDYRALQFWLNVGQIISYVVLGIYVWSSNRQKATVAEIKKVKKEMQTLQSNQEKRCRKHLTRTTTLEGAVDGLPTHTDLGEMHEKINGVKSAIDRMSGHMSGVNTQLKILVEHHLKGGQ